MIAQKNHPTQSMNKRSFLTTLGLLTATGPFLGIDFAKLEDKTTTQLLPNALLRGQTVGIISPSAAITGTMEITAKEGMKALGLKVKMGKYYKNRYGHLAGTDEERAADFNDMFADPEVKAIICLRGGSGAARILPLIDYDLVKANPKPLLGHSDVTALQCALFCQAGLISFHGPNGSSSWNDFHINQFQQLFFEQNLLTFKNEKETAASLDTDTIQIKTLHPGIVDGKILGGNLSVLSNLSGTPYYPDFQDAILFIEDVGELPYRIDRMMSTLKLNGTLGKIKGFVFGQCSDFKPTNGSFSVDQIIEHYILPLGIPAFIGAMIGHIPKQFILPVGANVQLNANLGTITMLENVFKKS